MYPSFKGNEISQSSMHPKCLCPLCNWNELNLNAKKKENRLKTMQAEVKTTRLEVSHTVTDSRMTRRWVWVAQMHSWCRNELDDGHLEGLETLLRWWWWFCFPPVYSIHTLHPLSDHKMKKDKHGSALRNSLVPNGWIHLPSWHVRFGN